MMAEEGDRGTADKGGVEPVYISLCFLLQGAIGEELDAKVACLSSAPSKMELDPLGASCLHSPGHSFPTLWDSSLSLISPCHKVRLSTASPKSCFFIAFTWKPLVVGKILEVKEVGLGSLVQLGSSDRVWGTGWWQH